jgi:hypothetical protein
MRFLLILAQSMLFAVPVTSAYAQQIKKDVAVAVTYTLEKPKDVCISSYELADTDYRQPLKVICVKDIHPVGNIEMFRGERLDMVNFMVIVRYPSGKSDVIYLSTVINT